MDLFSIEREPRRQRPPQLPQAFKRLLPAAVAAHLELAIGGDPNLDLIALLELQRVDNRGRKPHG
jgi:hypothetical protein